MMVLVMVTNARTTRVFITVVSITIIISIVNVIVAVIVIITIINRVVDVDQNLTRDEYDDADPAAGAACDDEVDDDECYNCSRLPYVRILIGPSGTCLRTYSCSYT